MSNQFNIERGRIPLLGLEKEIMNQFDIERDRIPLLGLEKEVMNQFDTERDRIPQLLGLEKLSVMSGECQRNVKPIQH